MFGFKPEKIKQYHQTGRSQAVRDSSRRSLPPGRRESKNGKVYYEYRKNRSDYPGKLV